MRVQAGTVCRFRGVMVRIVNTDCQYQKAQIEFAGGRKTWVMSRRLTD